MVDEIIEVGSEEDFLSRMSTLKLMRQHQSKAGNIDRRVREEWEMDGSNDMYGTLKPDGQGSRGEPQGRRAAERRRGQDQGDRQEEREGRRDRLNKACDTNSRRERTKDPMADFESLKKMIIAGDDVPRLRRSSSWTAAPRRATSSIRRCYPAWTWSAPR